MLDPRKRTVILARREKRESIREIAAAAGISVGAVHGVVAAHERQTKTGV
ncbi:sigma factor-like helix-turn-helix DNA-binding protein [Brevibacterium sp. BRM-1]